MSCQRKADQLACYTHGLVLGRIIRTKCRITMRPKSWLFLSAKEVVRISLGCLAVIVFLRTSAN